MKKAYLAISYSKRKHFDKEVASLKNVFERHGLELLVFVDNYNFQANQEKEMMTTAFQEIDQCDVLIAELTTKSIGVGIEIGYAVAKGIPIMYLRRKNAEYSTTAAGSSDCSIEYENELDLQESVEKLLHKMYFQA